MLERLKGPEKGPRPTKDRWQTINSYATKVLVGMALLNTAVAGKDLVEYVKAEDAVESAYDLSSEKWVEQSARADSEAEQLKHDVKGLYFVTAGLFLKGATVYLEERERQKTSPAAPQKKILAPRAGHTYSINTLEYDSTLVDDDITSIRGITRGVNQKVSKQVVFEEVAQPLNTSSTAENAEVNFVLRTTDQSRI